MKEKGSIILSDKVVISDPCYKADIWCNITLENVLPGNYKCFYDTEEDRISNIYIFHEKYKIEPTFLIEGIVDVSSGQAGIYDYDFFKEIKEDDLKFESFYKDICDLTCVLCKNPDYSPFEESNYYKFIERNNEEFIRYLSDGTELEVIIHKYIEHFKSIKIIDSNPKLKKISEAQVDIKEPEEIELIKSRLISLSHIKYLKDFYHSELLLHKFDANIYKEKAFISSSGAGYGDEIYSHDGNGIYRCYVGCNHENQIVSARVCFLE